MKKYLLIAVLILWAGSAWGATYHMTATGAGAKNGTNLANAWDITAYNAATPAAGDTIYLYDDHGDFTGIMTPRGNGTAGNYITHRAATGETPVIDAAGQSRGIYVNAKTDNKFIGIAVKNATTANIGCAGDAFRTYLENMTVTDGVAAGLQLTGGASVTVSGGTYNANGTYGISQVAGGSPTGALTITGAEVADNTASGLLTATSGAVVITNSDFHGNTVTTAGSNATINGSGTATITNSYFDGAVGANSNGLNVGGTVVATITGGHANSNTGDGYQANETSTSTYWRATAHDNGSSNAASGDGWTAHDTAVLNVYYCLGYNNWKSGVAVTEGSSGNIINDTFVNNYNVGNDVGDHFGWSENQGIGIDATGAWVIENNITSGNGSEIVITADALSGRAAGTLTINNNVYYDSRGGSAFTFNGTNRPWATWLTDLNSSAAVTGKDVASKNENPLFTSATDFTLQSTSPAINAGAFVSGVHNAAGVTDLAGKSLHGPSVDIGAYGTAYPGTKWDYKE